VVADDHDVAVAARELVDEVVLGAVGVLVLVDEQVAEALLVVLEDRVEELEDLDGLDDEVVEVEGVRPEQPVLVGLVDVGDLDLGPPAGALLVGLEVDQLVLGVADGGLDRARGEPLVVDAELLRDLGDQPLRVLRVVDGEAAAVAQAGELATQDPDARLVEGGDPHPVGQPVPHQPADPLGHLAGGLVGEGDREDLERVDVVITDQVGDPVGEHPGLARPRTGDDEHRSLDGLDRLALRGVEPLEQRGRFGRHGGTSGGRRTAVLGRRSRRRTRRGTRVGEGSAGLRQGSPGPDALPSARGMRLTAAVIHVRLAPSTRSALEATPAPPGAWREAGRMPFIDLEDAEGPDIVGEEVGARRLFLRRGTVPAGTLVGLHVHHGDEVIRVVDGTLEVVLGGERRRCGPGVVVAIPPGTEHGFVVIDEATIEVFGEQRMGEFAVVVDDRGERGTREVFTTAPWSRSAPPGQLLSAAQHLALYQGLRGTDLEQRLPDGQAAP
jgi:quercetin dioxygenase-like cupin family protein